MFLLNLPSSRSRPPLPFIDDVEEMIGEVRGVLVELRGVEKIVLDPTRYAMRYPMDMLCFLFNRWLLTIVRFSIYRIRRFNILNGVLVMIK